MIRPGTSRRRSSYILSISGLASRRDRRDRCGGAPARSAHPLQGDYKYINYNIIAIIGLPSDKPALCFHCHLRGEPSSPPHFFLSLNWMGTVSMSLRDLIMSLVVAAYFLKCADSRCELKAASSAYTSKNLSLDGFSFSATA